jgi:hypothetical protein
MALFILVSVPGCGYINSDSVFKVATLTVTFKPLRSRFEEAVNSISELQDKKDIFSSEEYYALMQGQESISYVLNRLEAIEAHPDSWITLSELKFLWNRVVEGYNSMRGVIVSNWDRLPTTMKLDLIQLDEQAREYSTAMDPMLNSNETKDVDKILTVFKGVISLAIKLMGTL